MNQFSQYASIATSRVDPVQGVIYGVSVVTMGEAEGHKLWIDKTTLSQVRDVANQFSDGVKVKLRHDGKGEEQSPVHSIVGSLKNFRVKADKVVADLHLLKTDDHFEKIIEMAQQIPSEFGLSIAFTGIAEKIEEKNFARCEELYSVDLTDDPAANPDGLFSKAMKAKEPDGAECKCNKPDCKVCMSRKQKESNNKMSTTMNLDTKKLLSALKLPENATEEQLSEALITRLTAAPADTTELSKKLDSALVELEGFKKQGANAVSLAKKAELNNLIAEAAMAGKVIPYDNDDIYTEKDGVVSIKIEPVALAKVISKLQPTVKLARATALQFSKDSKGEVLKAGQETTKDWCLAKQAEGAATLTERFSKINKN